MRTIEFVEAVPKDKYLLVLIGDQTHSQLSESLKEFIKSSRKAVVSIFFENQEYVILNQKNLEFLSKQERETLGALLAKQIKEFEGKIVLDFRKVDLVAIDFLAGFLLEDWSFEKYKTNFSSPTNKLIVLVKDSYSFSKAYEKLRAEILGVYYARDLTMEPANILYPTAYAQRLKSLEALGIEVEIVEREALEKIGMRALLAVSQGSDKEPVVAVIHWKGDPSSKTKLALIGKGVCFDSGGLCIKPGKYQVDMKWDKAGAGVVAGVIKSLSLLKAPINVVGILGLVENMPDGKSVKPGDILTALSGKTVEIIDTDAEGRLVLADCLAYAEKQFSPEIMIDLGTLTQETFAALGSAYAGLYTNDNELLQDLKDAGDASLDKVWSLPMGEYFANQIKSSVADMKNLGEEQWGENGAAAEFLKAHITMKKWAHIDIAGVSWTLGETRKVTGFGVRLLLDYIKNLFV